MCNIIVLAVFLALLCVCSSTDELYTLYHITPSTQNIPCPMDPCLTLQQFATTINTSGLLFPANSTLSIMFLPGAHSLSSELFFTNVSSINFFTNVSSSMNEAAVMIICERDARFVFVAIGSVYMSNLSYTMCKGHQVKSVSLFVIKQCIFLNHTETAIQFFGSTVYIRKTYFVSNEIARPGHTRRLLTYELGSSGATISLTRQSKAKIFDCFFEKNNANLGGVIFMKSFSAATIRNSTFKGNSHSAINKGGTLYAGYRSYVNISNCTFERNSANRGGSIFMTSHSTIIIQSSKFNHNHNTEGGTLYVESECVITIINCSFHNNSAGTDGGVFVVDESLLFIHKSNFIFNEAIVSGGVIYAVNHDQNNNFISSLSASGKGSLVVINESNFLYNSARRSLGGVLYAKDVLVTVINSQFSNNIADNGGVMKIISNSTSICNSNFTNNTAQFGGVVSTENADIIIQGGIECKEGIFSSSTAKSQIGLCKFAENKADIEGGVIRASKGSMTIVGGFFTESFAYRGGILYSDDNSSITFNQVVVSNNSAIQGVVYFVETFGKFSDTFFSDNQGSFLFHYSSAIFFGNTTFVNCLSQSSGSGGAISIFQSDVTFEGRSSFLYNFAANGGAINAIASKIHIYGEILLSNNTAVDSGGSIYLYQSEVNCKGKSALMLQGNNASSKGGGIHAIGSSITAEYSCDWATNLYLGSRIEFVHNMAGMAGGGLFLELNAKINVLYVNMEICDDLWYTFVFSENSADYGGALYVSDSINSGTCSSVHFGELLSSTECFLQTIAVQTSISYLVQNTISTKFTSNIAKEHGSSLFGGLLDRCTLSSFSVFGEIIEKHAIDGAAYITSVSNIELDSISSNPVRLCFCNGSHLSDCSYHPSPKSVKKGETFVVELAAVDQVNHTISATIHSYLKSNESRVGEGQLVQNVNENCTSLTFNLFSTHDFEELIMYADGPCKDAKLSQRTFKIQFSNCTCPVGFQPKLADVRINCVCECDSKLKIYITDCDHQTQTVTRKGNAWISYVNATNTTSGGYLAHLHCPLDYCKPSNLRVDVKIYSLDGADAQCANNRMGLLCGSCKPNFSLSLGSSTCLTCSTDWPAIVIVIILFSALAGVVLVIFILVLDLTVAVGSLNRIIFYANIVAASSNTFLPFPQPTFATVFISWLNLELGINVCFFKGMDTYWKTWLQLVFPLYLILLVNIVIFVSHWSKRFSLLIGKKNPVATLAMLILLSYAKLLHTIIAAFSNAVLLYPSPNGGQQKVVWLLDASIGYLNGRHIPLFIAAIFILLIGVIYTTLLFAWQWLIRFNERKFLKPIRNQKLKLFIETYHAPYNPQNRYWTGLLLFVRVLLYVAYAMNVPGDPRVNVLVVGIATVCLLFFKEIAAVKSRVYKKWPIELLEVSCLVNLALLSLGTFFTLENKQANAAIANTSVSITFVTFLGVLSYHIFKSELAARINPFKSPNHDSEWPLRCNKETSSFAPTTSVVEAPKQPEKEQNIELREPLLEHTN